MSRVVLALIACLPLVASAQDVRGNVGPGGVRVVFIVESLESTEGHVLCGLYAGEDSWLSPDYFLGDKAPPQEDGTARCVFEQVPPGTYAILAFHDEDDDAALDRGILGIPREPYAVSLDGHRRMRAPNWRGARFELADRPRRFRSQAH